VILLEKQEMKIEIVRPKVAVKQYRKENMLILTSDMSNMDPEMKACHMIHHQHILQEMYIAPATPMPTTLGSAERANFFHLIPYM
jgi:hypothetical protein